MLLSAAALLTIACEKVPLLAPSGSTITLTALATALPSNGTTDIIAQVIESGGTPPHSGTHVSFTTTLGTIQPSEAETDIGGRVTVKYVAGADSGTATITAISGGVSASGTNAIKIAVGAAAAASIGVSASPGTVPAVGGTSTISAKVIDTNGNLLPGVPVSFSTDNGTLSASVLSTDSTGTATTQLTTNKTAKVTATTGVSTPATGTTTTAAPSASVTVNVNAVSTITVGAPSPASPNVGQAVTFPLTYAQNANGSPVARVVIDFGDGSAAQTITGQPSAASHTYSQVGSYTVKVTAFDTFGDTATGTGSVTVTPKPALVVTLTTSTQTPAAGSPTIFTIAATPTTGAAITSVVVDFGDGTQTALNGNTTSVQHSYNAAGTFSVTVVATDSSGATGSASTIIVVGSAATASFTVSPDNPPVNTSVSFDASASSSSSTITAYSWDFGDGSTGSGVRTTHSYTIAGPKNVTLTITDSAGHSAIATKQITVH
ncbi:MAG: PKD domain-containing protein [Vicinamibacterales bacterium]